MDASRKPEIIELFGLPGAGKTAVCMLVGGSVDGFDVYCGRRFDDSWRPMRRLGRRLALGVESLRRPKVWLALGALTWRLRLWRSGRALVRIARLPLARVQLEVMPRDGQPLMDQALLQDVWSILLSVDGEAPRPEVLSPFLAELYSGLSVRILAFDIDVQTAAGRVSERPDGMSRFDGLPRDSIIALLDKAEPMTLALVEAARHCGLKIDAIDATQKQADVVADALSVLGTPTERPQ